MGRVQPGRRRGNGGTERPRGLTGLHSALFESARGVGWGRARRDETMAHDVWGPRVAGIRACARRFWFSPAAPSRGARAGRGTAPRGNLGADKARGEDLSVRGARAGHVTDGLRLAGRGLVG